MMLFENPPSIGQFALNGIWNKALSFGVDKPPSIKATYGRYYRNSSIVKGNEACS